MTSLSGLSSAAMTSPADRMKLQLQSMVSAGSVKSADQSALSSALDDIDAAMKSSGRPKAGTDPSTMKAKIDSLVDSEVSSGKLTDDQATELKQVFAQAAPPMGGPGGAGGPPPPPPSGDGASSDSDSTTGSTSSTDTSKQAIEALISFLKQLEQATSSSTNYTASGTSSASTTTSMLVDSAA